MTVKAKTKNEKPPEVGEVRILPIDEAATPDPNNVNKHTSRGGTLLSNSLGRRGANRSVASAGRGVDTPVLTAGNYTYEKAVEAGFEKVMNVYTDGKTLVNVVRLDIAPGTAEAVALGIEDNEIGKQSYSPDIDIVAALAVGDSAILSALRASDKTFDGMLEGMGVFGEAPKDAEPEIDRAAELLEKWQVKTGDLWQIGNHRLLCGDSTDAAAVARVMDGEKADMTFIDIPYGVDYEGGAQNEKKREKLEGDETGDLYAPILKMCKEASKKHSPMYVWFAASVGKPVYDAVEAIGYEVRAMIIWNKLDAHYGAFMAQYMQKHEPCLYIVDGNANWIGASNEVTVWDVKQPSINEFHPTQKPIELAMRAIGNHTADIVIDFCLGSGTTLVACENLGRRGRGIEISPAYCAVTLQRMSDAFPALSIKRLE